MHLMHLNLPVPDESFDAYIFDCDGTLADTMPLHYSAWRKTLNAHGCSQLFPIDQFYSMGGISPVDIIATLNAEHGCQLDPETLAHEKEQCFMNSLHSVEPIEIVTRFARSVATNHPVAVVSGGLKPIVLETMKRIGMEGIFNPVITPEDVTRGKPHPDMFLLAAEKMNVQPEKCLVFEDGQSGIDGAHAARMQTVFIPTPPPALPPKNT